MLLLLRPVTLLFFFMVLYFNFFVSFFMILLFILSAIFSAFFFFFLGERRKRGKLFLFLRYVNLFFHGFVPHLFFIMILLSTPFRQPLSYSISFCYFRFSLSLTHSTWLITSFLSLPYSANFYLSLFLLL